MIYKIQLLPVSTRLETILVSSIGKLIGRNLRSRSGELGTDTNFCNDDGCTKIPKKSSNFKRMLYKMVYLCLMNM
jgi:hypothetical protein